MERNGTAHDVAFARSTWRKARAFQEGLEELQSDMPLSVARGYLIHRTKAPGFPDALYERVEQLQALRQSAIQGEIRYVKAQVYYRFRDGEVGADFLADHSLAGVSPQEAESLLERALMRDTAEGSTESAACAELLLGRAVLEGDDLRYGFSSDLYRAAPSLGVYELFMWTTAQELDALGASEDRQLA